MVKTNRNFYAPNNHIHLHLFTGVAEATESKHMHKTAKRNILKLESD